MANTRGPQQLIHGLRLPKTKTLMMTKRIEFRPPPGVVPEGLTAGEEFDAVTTYRIKNDGNICAVMIGDVKLPGYDNAEYKPEYQRPEEMA